MMLENIEILDEWITSGNSVAIARVTKTWGSSPRPVGSVMFINDKRKMLGSVSGGCVEGAVVKKALDAISKKESQRLSYGVSDEDAWSVGLSCGGSIQVFLQYVNFAEDSLWKTLLECSKNNKSAILISSLEDGTNKNSLITQEGEVLGDTITEEVKNTALSAYDQRSNKTVTINETEYFIHIFPRKSQLIVVGAAHITVDLVALGNQFGFETIVIDPRGYFAQNTTFYNPPSQLIEAYPSEVLSEFPLDAYTFCAILSHDPKIDDNALEILLPSKVGYIGALGSRKNHEKRTKRLLEKGISQELIDKINAPIGLPINAKTAREIALSIMGKVIEAKNRYL